MSSAISLNFGQPKILSSGNGLRSNVIVLLFNFLWDTGVFFILWRKNVVLYIICLTLSQTTNFRRSSTERACRRQIQICLKRQKVLQIGRKHCEKRRNCSLRAISSFPTVFSKDFYCRHVKTRACLGTLSQTTNFTIFQTERVRRRQFQIG